MFKPDGPEALRPVGETEFVNGIAAMSASGLYGKTRIAAGIVGTADLRLGDGRGRRARRADRRRRRPLSRHPPRRGLGRRRRRAATTAPAPPQGLLLRDDFRAGFAELAPRQLTFEAWCYHPPDPGRDRAGPRVSRHDDHPQPLRRADRRRLLRRPGRRGLRRVARVHRRARDLPERRGQARRDQHGGQRLRLARAAAAAVQPGAGGRDAAATTSSPSRSSAPTAACSSRTSPSTR